MFLKEVITFSKLWEEEEAWIIRREEKMEAIEDPSSNEEYEELNSWRTSYPPQHLDRKWCYHEWRRRWSWRLKKENTHETNKDKYSTVISWYCFVTHLIVFSWRVMHDILFTLIIQICMWWVSSSWCYTTLQCYLSNLFADILD